MANFQAQESKLIDLEDSESELEKKLFEVFRESKINEKVSEKCPRVNSDFQRAIISS